MRADPSLIPKAVEESLRYEAPVLFLFRSAREDIDLGGCPVHTGDHLMLHIGAAQPRRAGLRRTPRSSGSTAAATPSTSRSAPGPHLCLGNHLTRMVGKVVLEEVLAVFPPGSMRLADGFEWECVDHMLEYGPERLDVVVTG